ncbi:hypothetical protein D9M69_481190 [compost metagenome]
MGVNDDALSLDKRGAFESIASELAPTGAGGSVRSSSLVAEPSSRMLRLRLPSLRIRPMADGSRLSSSSSRKALIRCGCGLTS